MRIVFCLLLTWLCYTECVCDDDLFPTSTVDLVSVLRRNLVTNNDDFTPAPHTTTITATTQTYPTHTTQPDTTKPTDISPGWRRINIVVDKKPVRKSEYLLPNRLIPFENDLSSHFFFPISKPRLRTIDPKKFTTTRTTTEGVHIFYETITKPRPVYTNAVPYLRAGTGYKGLVIDDNDLLASYTPFAGKNLNDMKMFIATKFFDFQKRPGDRLARIVPTTWTTLPPILNNTSSDEMNLHVLDLAPAKGPHIDKARKKGRICDRNVLFPEGPKYHKNGEPYTVFYYNDFVTPGRRYVVPRCCNCCKKSQLGCE